MIMKLEEKIVYKASFEHQKLIQTVVSYFEFHTHLFNCNDGGNYTYHQL